MRLFFSILAVFFSLSLACAQDFDSQTLYDLRSAGNGIDVDHQGRVSPISKEKSTALGKLMQDVLEPPPENMNRQIARRTISLKKLDAQINHIVEHNDFLPDVIRYFGGLTSIDYVVAVPEENDLLLIGPAEGWRADAEGNVVGTQTGKPILVLEDFLTALRLWNNLNVPPDPGKTITIMCSFDPPLEMHNNFARLSREFPRIGAHNVEAYSSALSEISSEVPISLTGISESSRFARILVAADFQMKRIALGITASNVLNLPSYVSMVSVNQSHLSPQFWLAPHYTATTHDSRKLTWRLGDVKIRVQSRNLRSNAMDRAAFTWTNNFEANYDALAKSKPIFGELRNNMKIALTASLIHHENLFQRANCQLTILLDENKLPLMNYPVPEFVEFSSVQSRNGSQIIVAYGGIMINPFGNNRIGTEPDVIRLDNTMDSQRTRLLQFDGDEWWSQ